jgi:uncharacterized protein DUF222
MKRQQPGPEDDDARAGKTARFDLADWPETPTVSPVRLLDEVSRLDPLTVDERLSVGAAAACEHVLRYVTSLQLRFLARAARVGGPEDDPSVAFDEVTGVDLTAAEIAPMLGLSRRSAQNKVTRALGLVTDLPKLVDLVAAGSIDLQRAVAVDDVMREVLGPHDEAWRQIHDTIVERVSGRTLRRVRELTRRAINDADPGGAARRHEEAASARRVALDPLPNAMAMITAILPADEGQLVDTVLDALADGCRHHQQTAGTPDTRTHEQRRADAFVALFRSVAHSTPLKVLAGANASAVDDQLPFGGRFEPTSGEPGLIGWWIPPELPRQQGRRPQINVTMSWSTLMGADEQAADLAGYGPIPAPLARAIAEEAKRYRVVALPDAGPRRPARPASAARGVRQSPTAPRAQLAWSSASRTVKLQPPRPELHGPGDQAYCTAPHPGYRPPQSMIDRVVAFHQVCRHPGCARRAQSCDVDHVVRFPEGRTCPCNLMPLCRAHHRLKTHGGWTARFTSSDEGHPPGTVEWTSRLGRRYYDVPTVYDDGFPPT